MKTYDEQFTVAIPKMFFLNIHFRDVSLKNYLILYVKQKNMRQNLKQGSEMSHVFKQGRGLKASAAQLYQDFL